MALRIVDIHPHIISPDTARYPRDPLGGKLSHWARDRPTTYAQLIEQMDRAGVAGAAIVQASTCYGHDNSYVADAVAAHPERFTGVFSVDVLAAGAPERIRHWLKQGLAGLRLFTAGSTMAGQADWIDDPKTFPAWQCCAELGIPVCMQMTQPGIAQLNAVIERFPTVNIILDHLMKPPIEDGPPYAGAAPMFALARYQNVYLKLTTVSVRAASKGNARPESFFRKVLEHYGASRIAWGSNYPASEGTLAEMLDEAHAALSFLSAEEQQSIFGGTARRLYPALGLRGGG
jgi:predicted TIM-barrel fold metal-dependent hydrolase